MEQNIDRFTNVCTICIYLAIAKIAKKWGAKELNPYISGFPKTRQIQNKYSEITITLVLRGDRNRD